MLSRVSRRPSFSRSERWPRGLLLAAALLVSGGCSTVSYYAQAVSGQIGVMAASRPLDDVLADPRTAEPVRQRLRLLPELRRFATDELHLVASRSYRTYADLGREAMVWSVVATPADSLEPRQWCYPIVGCASYRGYFDHAAAANYAAGLAEQGWDVAVEPVPAYSTLGWFSDPVPSTVVHWPVAHIAGLIFHELAHETLYLPGDSAFNEAYASVVEREGVRRWLPQYGTPESRLARRRADKRRGEFLGLIDGARKSLQRLYASDTGGLQMQARKAEILGRLRAAYVAQKHAWGGYRGYDRWFERPLNNARIASVSTYNGLSPVFESLLRQVGADMPRFHAECRALAVLPDAQRERRIQDLLRVATSRSKPMTTIVDRSE